MTTSDEEWVAVQSYGRKTRARDAALVLEARGIPYRSTRFDGRHLLLVRGADAARAERELAAYESENAHWPPRYESFPSISAGLVGALVYAAVLGTAFVLERRSADAPDWWQSGTANAARIRSGELWRTITALTLHVDALHLASNVAFGALFGALLSQAIGTGTAWLAVLAGGALGNLANAFVHDPSHVSVGASTAVFAAVGLLSAYHGIRRGAGAPPLRRFGPILMGVVLLGLYGMGGSRPDRTDVTAHCLGFLAGGLLGTPLALLHRQRPPSPERHPGLGIFALLAIAGAWAAAYFWG